MEGRIKSLFDYQKYEGNPALQQVIDSVHARYNTRELSMDEMETVAAAGDPYAGYNLKGEKDANPGT